LGSELFRQVQSISLETNKPMWQVVSDLVKDGLQCNNAGRRPKRQKVNKYKKKGT
jgi:hypothetical protein